VIAKGGGWYTAPSSRLRLRPSAVPRGTATRAGVTVPACRAGTNSKWDRDQHAGRSHRNKLRAISPPSTRSRRSRPGSSGAECRA
jgi:hypothetical protein